MAALKEAVNTENGLTTQELVHNGVEAILKNGYYEVNGFKFSKYYYERLWAHGRPAPSLAAREILTNAKSIVPDDKLNGFFKYMTDNWEMIYNPVTKYEAKQYFDELQWIQEILAELLFKFDVKMPKELLKFVGDCDRLDDDRLRNYLFNKIKNGEYSL